MASITTQLQPDMRGPSVANNSLSDPISTTPRAAPQFSADLPVGNVHDLDALSGALADQRIEARVAAVLSEVEAIGIRARDVYVSVSNGAVTLYGAVRASGAAREIVQAVRTNAGIDTVQNYIHTIGARSGD